MRSVPTSMMNFKRYKFEANLSVKEPAKPENQGDGTDQRLPEAENVIKEQDERDEEDSQGD